MKLTKELKDKIDTYFESKTPEELEYIFKKYKPKRKKKVVEEVLEEEWVDIKVEEPKVAAYFEVKVKGSKKTVIDWWGLNCFAYNDNLVTHWKRK